MSSFFSGCRALVTGGGSGIGRAVATEMARRGAQVHVTDIDGEAAAEVAANLGNGATSETLDVRDGDAVETSYRAAAERMGGLDLVFNNAGIAIIGHAIEFEREQYDRLIDINFRGVVYGTLAAYRIMSEQGRGRIVNNASVSGLIPAPGFAGYAATKHAVVGLSTSMRVEAALKGVDIQVVCPGFIDTPIKENAEVVGIDRERGTDAMPVDFYPVERCARDIADGIEAGRPIIVVTRFAKVAWLLWRLSPRRVLSRLVPMHRKQMEKSR